MPNVSQRSKERTEGGYFHVESQFPCQLTFLETIHVIVTEQKQNSSLLWIRNYTRYFTIGILFKHNHSLTQVLIILIYK